jgi:2-polyprenyl-3-methyl-5-hydroxy-6-metoxy-1,4-benzoquinol methylase
MKAKAQININTVEYWNEVYRSEWEKQDVVGDNYHRDYGPIHDAIIKIIPAGSRVLDIACGPGLLCRKIKERLPISAVTGVDFSSYAIARNAERDGPLGIEYACMDIRTSLRSIGKEFDVVTMCEIIEHLDDAVSAIRDAMSLLKHNGVFIVSCPHADEIPDPEHVREWDHESLFHLLSPYGSSISFRQFPRPYFHYWMLAHLKKDAV